MSKDMTVGNPTKLIVTFSIPLLIGNIFQQFYNMVDAMIVGKYLGVNALASVGATGAINFLILGFTMGLTGGFSIPVAQSFGANDDKKVQHYTMMSIYLGLIATVMLTFFTVALTRPLLTFMETPIDIIEGAVSYIRVIYWGLGGAIFYNMLAGILRAVGDSRTPLYFLILSSILNIVLDIVFIVGLGTGVEGAAYATIISQGISALLCYIYMVRKYPLLRWEKAESKFNTHSAKHMLKIGIPMALQFSITAIGAMILQSAVNGLGSVMVAAYTAASKVEQLAVQPLVTLGITMATYTGQNLGANRIDRIKDGTKKCVMISVVLCIAITVLMKLFGGNLVHLFVESSQQAVIAAAKQYLNTVAMFFIPLGLLFIYRNVLQGLGNGFIPMLAGAAELVGRAAVALAFVGVFGFQAICFASPVAWVLAAVLLMVFYYKQINSYGVVESRIG